MDCPSPATVFDSFPQTPSVDRQSAAVAAWCFFGLGVISIDRYLIVARVLQFHSPLLPVLGWVPVLIEIQLIGYTGSTVWGLQTFWKIKITPGEARPNEPSVSLISHLWPWVFMVSTWSFAFDSLRIMETLRWKGWRVCAGEHCADGEAEPQVRTFWHGCDSNQAGRWPCSRGLSWSLLSFWSRNSVLCYPHTSRPYLSSAFSSVQQTLA